MLAALPEAAKQEMPLFGPPCADADPALETSNVAKNSRQGFRLLDSTLRLASGEVKSRTALGIAGTLYGAGIRSRCTGKKRDTETGLDYFGARYYSNGMGRFVTPDWSAGPATVPYAHLDNPQTLNLYSYVDNNPLNGIDADGHAISHAFDGMIAGLDAGPPKDEGGPTQTQAALTLAAMSNSAFGWQIEEQQAQNQDKPQQSTQQPQQSNPRPQQPSVSVTTDTYSATSNGVSIQLTATVTGSSYANFNWVQTITTNAPLGQNPANTPYIDRDPGQRTSYYLNPSEQAQSARAAAAHGASTIFSDNPQRISSGSTVSWHAHLSLVGIKSDGHYHVLKTFGYGFTMNATGVHIDPLKTPY
jgi:RHS repeat-associated protein